jgi:hypothetical protein
MPNAPPSFLLTFAGVPFVADKPTNFNLDMVEAYRRPDQEPDLTHTISQDLIEEIERLLNTRYFQDVIAEDSRPGAPLDTLATRAPAYERNPSDIHIGDWFYPTGALRWSTFRGLMTSSQVKAVLQATWGSPLNTQSSLQAPGGLFVMNFSTQGPPLALPPGNTIPVQGYSISSPMYMLPPRPLGEQGTTLSQAIKGGGSLDGLYLITLVDERYFWRRHPISFDIDQNFTWAGVLKTIANTLGISLSYQSIPAAYGRPESDSQLDVSYGPAPVLLNAIACTLGLVLVRSLNATYQLMSAPTSYKILQANRGLAQNVVRDAGGDIFASGTLLPAGDLTYSRNAIIPSSVKVTFPIYVYTDQSGGTITQGGGGAGQIGPVPHYMNPRYQNQRQTVWWEDDYGGNYTVDVPLLSGGLQFAPYYLPISGVFNSGLIGVLDVANAFSGGIVSGGSWTNISGGANTTTTWRPIQTISTTAKALYSGETAPTPVNASGLIAAAMQVAQDFYGWQAGVALDEAYPGTVAWQPEGGHDILWQWSERENRVCTRVFKAPWNQYPSQLQFSHAELVSGQAASGSLVPYTTIPGGVGGRSVAQTWRDAPAFASGAPTTPLIGGSGNIAAHGAALAMASGDYFAYFESLDKFPTQNRWKGWVGNEKILFEGTSGQGADPGLGANPILSGYGYRVNIVQRGIDGTVQVPHLGAGTVSQTIHEYVTQALPDTAYGVNLVSLEPGLFAYPQEATSGGIAGVRIVCPSQVVKVCDGVGFTLSGITYYSGRVQRFDSVQTSGNQFLSGELCWVLDVMYNPLSSGRNYVGKMSDYFGFTKSAPGKNVPTAPLYLVQHGVMNVICDVTSGLVVFQ